MRVLEKLKPSEVFRYFETICGIPHGSGNTDAITDYLVKFAKERSLAVYRDGANNVVITKEASIGYEKADTLILQAHTDMVCEKNADMEFDFTKDGIRLVVDGDILRADGTTLGGDDGISVAMVLALLDDNSLKHPKLEILLTTDEEIGMLGAFAFDCSHFTGHKLINLDSEYEGILMCSCAGGVNARSVIQISREKAKLATIAVEISGLCSGHSGVEINKGRANSNVLMGRLLHSLAKEFEYRLAMLNGGSRETAIASLTTATIALSADNVEAACNAIALISEVLKKEYATSEPFMKVTATIGAEKELSVLSADSTKRVHMAIFAIPDGVQVMSLDMSGLVQTSLNFGLLELRENELTYTNSIRSCVNSQKEATLELVRTITELAGGKTEAQGSYPGWAYNPNSEVKNLIVRTYERLYGETPSVEAVHAGIECGLFSASIENLDCVSIGPNMADVHTTKEHLSISSTARTYELLKRVLEDAK